MINELRTYQEDSLTFFPHLQHTEYKQDCVNMHLRSHTIGASHLDILPLLVLMRVDSTAWLQSVCVGAGSHCDPILLCHHWPFWSPSPPPSTHSLPYDQGI